MSSPPLDDKSKDKNNLPDNELEVPILIKSKGVSQIIRYGGHKEGFVITIVYDDKPLSFPAPKDWTHIHRNYHAMCAANMVDKDLVQMLEYYLIQNSNWVIGFARTSDLPNGDKSAIDADYIDDTLTQEPVQVSVPIAIRTSYGNVIVQGLIVSMSDPFQLVRKERWQCVSCNKLIEKIVINMLEPIKTPKGCSYCRGSVIAKHEFVDARTLRIQHDDVTATDSMDSLSVIVFGNDTKDIQLGERVRLVGNIKMRQSLKNKEQYTNVVLVRDIKYESRRKIEVTPEDIIEIKEFRKQGEHIEELVNQFAPNVVGHRFAKLGILLAAVGAPEYFSKDPITNKKRTTVRGRINTLAIGEPGEAKTVLGNEATRLRPNSKSVSGTNTTGKAMTAMILSDPNGGRVLHLGPVALAKDAFFFINEFDKLSGEDRDAILGAMEEGRFGFNKFDANLDIEAQISVFATANPLNEKWLHSESIDINEIPFTIRMLSRFDIIIIFRDKDTKEDDMRYAVDKTEAMRYKDVSYDFLVKYIEYAREYYEPTLSPEAEIALQDYWIMIRHEFRMDTDFTATYRTTKRTLEVGYRLAKAFARLNLSDKVTITEVNQTINFITDMFKDFKLNVNSANDPFLDAYNETVKVIKDTTIEKPIELVNAIEIACANNKDVSAYIGKKFKQDDNKKLKNLCKKILEDKHVIRVGERPTKVYWKSDDKPLNDLNDLNDPGISDPPNDSEKFDAQKHAQKKYNVGAVSKISRSDRSLRSLRNEKADAPAKLEPQISVTNNQKEDEKLNTSLTIESNDKNLLVLREQRQQQPIADFICFDLEWDIKTQVITAFSYVASNGASGVVLIEDHNGVEKLLLKQFLAILSRYEYCFGWYSSGTSKFNNKKKKYEGKDSDLKTLDARLKANKLESIVDLQGFPRIINPKYNGNSTLSYDQRKSLKSMIHIDAHNIYNKPMVQKQIYNQSYLGYSLNSVAKAIVGRGKFSGYSGVDFGNMSIEDKRKYSFEDSQLLYEILAHDNFRVLKQMKTISDLTGVSIEAVCNYGPSNIWKRIINDKLGKTYNTNEDNEELADYGDPEEETEGSTIWVRPKGGTVENPIKGQYKNVAVVDVSSLYPSMVILKNLSFDSVNKCRCCFDLPECQVPEEIIDRKTMTEPKYWICKKKGVFTQAMKHFTYERLRHKKAGHKLESDCLKIVINSGYGLHASKYFPYHDLNTAALITAYGRYTFKKMKEMASELGMNVIYGDTDSIFIANKDGSSTERSKINELIVKCKEQLGVGIEHEKTFSKFLMLVKKHYIGIYDDDSKEPEIKGMEAKKSDRCEFVRKAFFQLVNDFKNDINPIPKLQDAFNKLDSKNIENPEQALLFQVKLGRNPDDYINENDRLRIAGKQLGLAKDDVAQLYHASEGTDKYISPLDFCIDECNMIKYKQSLKNVTKDILAILGYDIEKEIPSSIIKIDRKKSNRMKRAAGNKKLPIEKLVSLESTKSNKNMKEVG